MRANDPQDESAIAKHTLNNPGPKTAIIAMASNVMGKAKAMSINAHMTLPWQRNNRHRPKNKPVSKDMAAENQLYGYPGTINHPAENIMTKFISAKQMRF